MKSWGLLLLFSIFLVACGSSSVEPGAKSNRKAYVPLSTEEAKQFITPTVYYIPMIDQQAKTCPSQNPVVLKTDKEEKLVSLCPNQFRECLMQGTCLVKNGREEVMINYHKRNGAQYYFKKVNREKCAYGYGSKNGVCLDPYYSVAADPSLYNVGDVILVPDLRGLKLPSGKVHEGFFIVRDTGANIRGYGRFDFFIGFDRVTGAHPFVDAGLSDKSTHYRYEVLKGEEASRYLKLRQFPSVIVN